MAGSGGTERALSDAEQVPLGSGQTVREALAWELPGHRPSGRCFEGRNPVLCCGQVAIGPEYGKLLATTAAFTHHFSMSANLFVPGIPCSPLHCPAVQPLFYSSGQPHGLTQLDNASIPHLTVLCLCTLKGILPRNQCDPLGTTPHPMQLLSISTGNSSRPR
eukprot:gene8536-1526_t